MGTAPFSYPLLILFLLTNPQLFGRDQPPAGKYGIGGSIFFNPGSQILYVQSAPPNFTGGGLPFELCDPGSWHLLPSSPRPSPMRSPSSVTSRIQSIGRQGKSSHLVCARSSDRNRAGRYVTRAGAMLLVQDSNRSGWKDRTFKHSSRIYSRVRVADGTNSPGVKDSTARNASRRIQNRIVRVPQVRFVNLGLGVVSHPRSLARVRVLILAFRRRKPIPARNSHPAP